jgi:osmotically-inducible protein OsmY
MKTIKAMKSPLLAIMIGVSALTMTACAVHRDQSTAGEYVDDSVITAKIKTKFVESKAVEASAIEVETLKGTVQLSGFAKSADEKATAEKLAKSVEGVKSVKNDVIVKP